jgi:hypothetical protein
MAKRGKLKKIEEVSTEQRPVRFKRYQYLFLIVCEDEKTEPAYFQKFQENIPPETMYLKTVGTGRDAKGVVEKTLEERNSLAKEAKREVDVTWAVFDTDDADQNETRVQRFLAAFEIGQENNINLAYSNEVFELWLLMHLTEVTFRPALPRARIYKLLQEHICQHPDHAGFNYEHGDTEVLNIIQAIGSQEEAIERAKNLLEQHGERMPINANPSTKVHLLVQDLLGWITYYSYGAK